MTGTKKTLLSLVIFLPIVLGGCVSSQEKALNLAQNAGWQWNIIATDRFDLASARPEGRNGPILWIYIEGDGRAFLSPGRPASDPTPTDPVALRLALAHPQAVPVAYLARPCQYVLPDHGRNCESRRWTSERYAPDIIGSIDQAIEKLKRQSGASRLILAGYSGGGAVAVLIAARRTDVAGIVTVAANLDLAYWTKRDGLTPLQGSLDPADYAARVAFIPQVHFTGGRDDTVGTDVVRAFLDKLPRPAPARLIVVPDFTHTCCWAEEWRRLITAPDAEFIHAKE